ncbi:integrase [Oricola nitratireducens]|uniref:integrase n=1 Tax=Oricola nitratireducens TaxID=2775868 RepID=UPI001865F2EB|nr:site-specific integrase [Oricola nitratireducens]
MASIRKHRGKYQAQIRRNGFPSISRSFHQLKDAKEWARQMEVQADRAELEPNRKLLDTITLGELVKRYRDTVLPGKKCCEVETIILNAFLRHHICRKPLSRLSSADFASFRDERLRQIAPKSLKRQFSPIHNMFEVARDEWGLPIRENPLDKVKLQATDNKRERRLRDGEYERLIEAARTRQNPWIEKVIIFAIETGMRRGEILDLKWDQVDLRRRCVTILESKNGYSRTIPLTPTAVALLHSCRGGPGGNEKVFPVTANALKMAWGRMLVGTGINDLHFHDLRHEAISRFFEIGLTVPEVASISGHRNSAMLSRYGHAQMSRIQERLNMVVHQ